MMFFLFIYILIYLFLIFLILFSSFNFFFMFFFLFVLFFLFFVLFFSSKLFSFFISYSIHFKIFIYKVYIVKVYITHITLLQFDTYNSFELNKKINIYTSIHKIKIKKQKQHNPTYILYYKVFILNNGIKNGNTCRLDQHMRGTWC